MKAFAYLTHPLNIEQLKSNWPIARFLPNFAIKPLLKILPTCKITKINKIKSSKGSIVNGYIITLPILSDQLLEAGEQFSLDKISQAAEIASRLNVGVMGLGGEFSCRNYPVKNNFNVPVTNGSHFTVWSIIESVYRISKIRKLNLVEAKICILGASCAVGKLCAKKLSFFTTKLVICDKERSKLEVLKGIINQLNQTNIEIETDCKASVRDADIIVVISKEAVDELDPAGFKKDAIVCDATLGSRFTKKFSPRKDLTFIRCGLVKLPDKNKIIHSSLAEAILLAFEERFVSYSLNGNINLDKLEEIADIAARQGLEIWVPEAPVI